MKQTEEQSPAAPSRKPAPADLTRLQALAAAGARGHSLDPVDVRLICEALQAQSRAVRNQFHSGN